MPSVCSSAGNKRGATNGGRLYFGRYIDLNLTNSIFVSVNPQDPFSHRTIHNYIANFVNSHIYIVLMCVTVIVYGSSTKYATILSSPSG